jgi:hypothetical protein
MKCKTPLSCTASRKHRWRLAEVPKRARPGTFIVNCAIQLIVRLSNWPYEISSGLGGSAANALLEGRDPVDSVLDLGVGWPGPGRHPRDRPMRIAQRTEAGP